MHQPVLPDVLYYVTVCDGLRVGFLLGPYDTHGEALGNVRRARELAERNDPWSAFYGFGTANAPEARTIKTVFGK